MKKKGPWTLERLMGFVSIDPATSCWNWQGAKSRDGYGVARRRGEPEQLAHRRSYILIVGPIPEGFETDHLCRNPSCINPAHLEAVTPRVNKMRSRSPWALNAAKTHCKRGHELTEENVYRAKKGRSCRQCQVMHTRAYEARNPTRNNHLRHKPTSLNQFPSNMDGEG